MPRGKEFTAEQIIGKLREAGLDKAILKSLCEARPMCWHSRVVNRFDDLAAS